jgi:magnesium-transporting ATPase (P-type)
MFAAKSGFLKSRAVANLEDVETFKDGVRYKHVQEHHFDSTVKRMTVIYHDLEHQTNIAFMKGAPERVLDACSYNAQGGLLTSTEIDQVLHLMDRFATEGLVISLLKTLIVESLSPRF